MPVKTPVILKEANNSAKLSSALRVIAFLEKHPGVIDEIVFCGFDSNTEMEYAAALTAGLKENS